MQLRVESVVTVPACCAPRAVRGYSQRAWCRSRMIDDPGTSDSLRRKDPVGNRVAVKCGMLTDVRPSTRCGGRG